MTEQEKDQETYVKALCLAEGLVRQFELIDKDDNVNRTEVAMLSMIRLADLQGKQVISTQIASKLYITRSAVSQTVDRMEEKGLVCRTPSELDRKIAFIEMTDEQLTKGEERMAQNVAAFRATLDALGEEKAEQLLSLLEDLTAILRPTKKRR